MDSLNAGIFFSLLPPPAWRSPACTGDRESSNQDLPEGEGFDYRDSDHDRDHDRDHDPDRDRDPDPDPAPDHDHDPDELKSERRMAAVIFGSEGQRRSSLRRSRIPARR